MSPLFAHKLHAGDVWHRPNWDEHIRRAWPDERGIAIVTDEYPDIIQHLALNAVLDVDEAPS